MLEGIEGCTRCDLAKSRTRVVVGEGPLDAEVMFIGEAPGKNEDLQGRPFVGRAGEVLNRLLKEIGLQRSEVYITNIVKSRPPGNRNPTKEEIMACRPWLMEQIKRINPRLMVLLGRVAAESFLGRPVAMAREHGRFLRVFVAELGREYKAFITYHPAACVYNKRLEAALKEDFRQLK
jgi:DNA polymerase